MAGGSEADRQIKIVCHVTAGFPALSAACAGMPALSLAETKTLAELERELAGADGLIVFNGDYTAEVAALAARQRLRWIQFATAGVDNAEKFGVPEGCLLCNAGDVWAPTVAEHALALLLGLVRQIHLLERTRLGEDWSRGALVPAMGSLQGRTLALVGVGNIGREIAARARAFGPRIVGVMRQPRSVEGIDEAVSFERLFEVLAAADAVVLSLALTAQTHHLIGREALAAMKASAFLVNVARGGIVDETALIEALGDGRIAGAGLDVFASEPLPLDSPLRGLPNVILSPHVAGFGDAGAGERLVDLCRDNIRRFMTGEVLRNRIAL